LPGATALETLRAAGIPHASVCGGRARCSTCRVRVGAGGDALPAAAPTEAALLKRIGAPPSVRLACQLRPSADVELVPLLPPDATPADSRGRSSYRQGAEREIVVLFADLRGFTSFSEGRLPFDVVFVLNQYFSSMGQAIEGAGGVLDKFIGDGIMALFGVESGPRQGALEAIDAARAMSQRLVELNEALAGDLPTPHEALAGDLPTPLRVGIGLHLGPAIVGEMGWGRAISLTAIGDTVHGGDLPG
ncbi:MAG: adenylate/guanylate cyclase domain-containing protein, partial [Acetobacterales bacterium]